MSSPSGRLFHCWEPQYHGRKFIIQKPTLMILPVQRTCYRLPHACRNQKERIFVHPAYFDGKLEFQLPGCTAYFFFQVFKLCFQAVNCQLDFKGSKESIVRLDDHVNDGMSNETAELLSLITPMRPKLTIKRNLSIWV